jgi:hypothetical protein
MSKTIWPLIFCFLIGFSCAKDRDGLNKAATWEAPGSSGVVEFYYLKGTMSEPALKAQMMEIAKTWSGEFARVQIFAFHDKGFAKKMDSENLKQKVFSGNMALNDGLLSDPDLKIKGGAMLVLSSDKPEPQWYYQEPKAE